MFDESERDVSSIVLSGWGSVVSSNRVGWTVVDPDGAEVMPIRRFLLDFTARGNRVHSVRSYAYDLLRWWRWLRAIGVPWDQATPAEVRDMVLWLQQAEKPISARRTESARTVGQINPVTRKQHLGDHYSPAMIQHSNAVLRSFYDYWIDRGDGPLINPVQLDRRNKRPHSHHNPLEPFRSEGKIRYNPKIPKRKPRAIPDERWVDLFKALRANRDRAMLAVAISNGARAAELLGVRGVDLDWGDQLVRVVRKGTGAEQWLPASSEAFVWIRLYLNEFDTIPDLNLPLWWTLRRRDNGQGLVRQPVTYETLRAVLRRANKLLSTNWTMHDLRHTAAQRMARDESLSLKDVQTILGHQHLSTTADIYLVEDEAQVIRRVSRHLADRASRPPTPPQPTALGWDKADLAVLFGGADR